MTLAERLDVALACLAASGATIGYAALADLLEIEPPGRIAKLTEALEAAMRVDAARGHPLRAALCVARMGNGLPAPGFFLLARDLGRYDGAATGTEAAAFVAGEREALHARTLTNQ